MNALNIWPLSIGNQSFIKPSRVLGFRNFTQCLKISQLHDTTFSVAMPDKFLFFPFISVHLKVPLRTISSIDQKHKVLTRYFLTLPYSACASPSHKGIQHVIAIYQSVHLDTSTTFYLSYFPDFCKTFCLVVSSNLLDISQDTSCVIGLGSRFSLFLG